MEISLVYDAPEAITGDVIPADSISRGKLPRPPPIVVANYSR
jgi:5'-deoxynucleotidase YfbR-like HD superfamily hydrolase